jgi:nucleotide-binding universal stress UspA family protein
MTWKKICCAIDFSKRSRVAMVEAAELARRLDAELTLVYIHQPTPRSSNRELRSAAELLELAAEELHRTLALWKADAELVSGRPVRIAVFSGHPAAEIVRFARAHGTDAIVLGTSDRSGLARAVLGSIAEHVVREAPCAVVVARGGTAARATEVRWDAR